MNRKWEWIVLIENEVWWVTPNYLMASSSKLMIFGQYQNWYRWVQRDEFPIPWRFGLGISRSTESFVQLGQGTFLTSHHETHQEVH